VTVARYPTPHREFNNAVIDKTQSFVSENNISKKNPMTVRQMDRLISEIRSSTVPAIANYLKSIDNYTRQQLSRGKEPFCRRFGKDDWFGTYALEYEQRRF
jgi:hypothetical protein